MCKFMNEQEFIERIVSGIREFTGETINGLCLHLLPPAQKEKFLAYIKGQDFRRNPIILKNCKLQDINAPGLNIPFLQANNSRWERVILDRGDFSSGQFEASVFDNAELNGVNFQNANFTRAVLKHAGLIRSNLRNANLTGAYLDRANLKDSDVTGANLTNSSLVYTCMSGATITGSKMADADLVGTGFEGSDLRGIEDLNETNIDESNFNGTIITERQLKQIVMLFEEAHRRIEKHWFEIKK